MPGGYYRYPTIFEETVVFVCEDDLWSIPVTGGIARRLTSNLGEVAYPLFSPDGSQLAFVGQDEGPYEVYVMPAQGGATRRLTFLGSSACRTAAWLDNQRIVFSSNAGHWYLRFNHLYSISIDPQSPNQPQQLEYGLANTIAFGPQGQTVIGRNMNEPSRWKRYRGGRTGQLWVSTENSAENSGENSAENSGEFRPLNPAPGNLDCPMWAAGRLFFISDHEGIANLYSCLPTGLDVRRHTDHEDFYVRNASSDGRRIVYHAGADLYLYDPQTDQSGLIPIEFHSQQTQRNRRFANPARYLEDWTLHPSGQAIAVTARGNLFTFANWEGAVRYYQDPAPVDTLPAADSAPYSPRYRLPRWLKDGRRLIALTDAPGEERFVILHGDGSAPPVFLPEMEEIGRPELVAVNPQFDQIVFSNHRYELYFLDLETHELRLIDRSPAARIGGFDWSPDGRWVAYSIATSLQIRSLRLWEASSGEKTDLTRPVLRDISPAFDPQGKYLYFLSYRTFDPVSDNLQFDLNFPRGMKPYLITLQQDLPSPFIPQPRLDNDEKEDEDSGEEEKNPDAGADAPVEPDASEHNAKDDTPDEKPAPETKEPEPLQIDLEGIQDRIIAFPVSEGRYGRIKGTKDGKAIYSLYPLEDSSGRAPSRRSAGQGTLIAYQFDDWHEETISGEVNAFDLSSDGSTLIYLSGDRLRVLRAGDKPGDNRNTPIRKTGWLDMTRIKLAVNPAAEWRQMFREAWRLQRDQFWTPDMSKVDWEAVYKRYRPLVERVASRDEFSDLIWEMQGELGTSHAYESGGDYRPGPYYSQGYLGADYAFDHEQNAWRITHIYRGDAWEPNHDSPLQGPGINVQVGDYLLAVNGRTLDATFSPSAALVFQAREEVSLTLRSQPAASGESEGNEQEPVERTVTVRALGTENNVRYRAWVRANRNQVHAASDGRVGYIHIPDMGLAGYAEFHRGYLAEVDRPALIIDVRFNRGGNVSGLLLEKLARRRLGYTVSRWGQLPIPYPDESPAGPMVALTNEFAASDGDIFSHGFKLLNLGPLIGKRTWGGVIGISPRHTLVDGSLTTQPEYSTWFYDLGWGVENYGVDPDIEVDMTPQDYVQGNDAQLERAIAEALGRLETNPPREPDFSARPSRAVPRLPHRE